ncbi:protein containing Beta-ketoacyl synthase, partial [Candidatus Magnetomorum sp. HK-1]
ACLLSNPMNQLVIMPGLSDKIQYFIQKSCQDNPHIEKGMTSDQVDMSDIIEKTNGALKEMIFEILGVEINEIDIDENIENFGFDSISFTSLANAINDYYQINITPALFYGTQTISELSLLLIEKNPQIFQSLYNSKDARHTPSETKTMPKLISPKPIITRQYTTATMPVAIIGISAIFPQSNNISTFWNHIIAGHDLISKVPEERWDSRIYPIKWGGFIPDVDKFDPQFFGISPKEAELMDPQQRLCLQTIWKTIEDAGYRASDLSGSQTGVFI